ncbi:MAG: flavodoxin [Romboutsia sp.]|nr:flavodoxin [Romboutsia sp.]
MNNKIAVIYKSKYGATKRYAGWIALKLNADLYELSDIRVKDLKEYDTIIYGGPLYVGKIKGIKFIINNYEHLKNKKVKLFIVGMRNNDEVYINSILKNNIPEEILKSINAFYFRGKMYYKELSIKDKILIASLRSSISNKKYINITSNEKVILDIVENPIDFTDKKAIDNIVNGLYNEV